MHEVTMAQPDIAFHRCSGDQCNGDARDNVNAEGRFGKATTAGQRLLEQPYLSLENFAVEEPPLRVDTMCLGAIASRRGFSGRGSGTKRASKSTNFSSSRQRNIENVDLIVAKSRWHEPKALIRGTTE